ncbi:MAG: PEP-CTERM sorting domain-containing protein [Leptolyngbyaceae cyanobacterium]
MTIKNFAALAGLAAGATVALVAAPANAASINFTGGSNFGTCTDRATSCTENGFTFTADNNPDAPLGTPFLQTKTESGVSGLGISRENGSEDSGGNGVIAEIDYYETLGIGFEETIVRSLDLVFLYQAGEFSDNANEKATVKAGGGIGTLLVTGATTAEWSWTNGTESVSQTVDAKSPATNPGGGWFSILNPFDGVEVSSVDLLVDMETSDAHSGKFSDYSLGGITTVPEPATLLGLGAVAVGAFTGLRGSKKAKA